MPLHDALCYYPTGDLLLTTKDYLSSWPKDCLEDIVRLAMTAFRI